MANSTVYHLGGADGESFSTIRRTGWIPITDMSRNTTIRRLNARYKSPESVTAKIYADGNDTTPIWNDDSNNLVHFQANLNTDGTDKLDSNNKPLPKFSSLKIGRRANSILVEISTTASSSTLLEIGKLQVEVDAK